MDANSIAELLQSVAAATAVVRLWHLKLVTRFPSLFAWLILSGAKTFALSLLSQRSTLYFWIYVVGEPLATVFAVFAVRELLALVFRDYPGIRSVGRWGTYVAVAAAMALSLGASMLLVRDKSHGSTHLYYIEVVQRSAVFALALVILFVLFALSRYPLHLARNTVVSAVFFSSIFLSDTVRLLVDSLAIRLNNRTADLSEAAVIFLCLGTWAVLLQPQTAGVPIMAESGAEGAVLAFSSPAEAQLLSELDALNRLLSRAARN
jgi:hypothetical protein